MICFQECLAILLILQLKILVGLLCSSERDFEDRLDLQSRQSSLLASQSASQLLQSNS